MAGYVYILTNKPYGTLYIGVTNNLLRRVQEHKENAIKGFSSKYNLHDLIYFEHTESIASAIVRERQVKEWRRSWKINLIEKMNPSWKDDE